MSDIVELAASVVGADHVLAGDTMSLEYSHDESLTTAPVTPLAVVKPASTAEVSAILRIADASRVPVTARGSGTGLSGAAVAEKGGLLVSFERMNHIVEIDAANGVAVVQPGVTLAELDDRLVPDELVYPVFPGESSASIGGNIATNAGGMRAVKYGVTRHQVLGLQAVLAGGAVIRTGGKFVKSSTGYDLTQLIVGSEGTLALVTEATVKLYPRPAHTAAVLAPFPGLREATAAVPRAVASGVGPLMLEYIDDVTMSVITSAAGLDLGVPDSVKASTRAYLLVVLESNREQRLEEDVETVGELLAACGAFDVYVLPPFAATGLIDARERAFFVAKAMDVGGALDVIDVVVPRAAIPAYMTAVGEIAESNDTIIAGCGHAGDGNVHLSVLHADPAVRHRVMRSVFQTGMGLGGTISAEHGIGTAKRELFLELEDPTKVDLMRRIKAAFDPHGILAPSNMLGVAAAT